MRGLLLFVLGVACAPSKPASYPDRSKVKAAQAEWCEMLAKLDHEPLDEWRYADKCLAAYPTGSAVYVDAMAGCYGKTMTDMGEDALDSAAIISACTQELMAGADAGDVSRTELFQARCKRQERCQDVSYDVCVDAWPRVDPAARAMLTAMYNMRAQSEIAACLRDTDCAEDEQALENDCYQAAKDGRLWLPLSL